MTTGLSPEIRKYIGRVSVPVEAADEVNKAMIRIWCEMLEDANPLYTNETYARSSEYRGIISPPTMLLTWAMPAYWPAPHLPPEALIDQMDLPLEDLSLNLSVEATDEYLLPLRPGDKLSYRTRLDNVTPLKQTRLGSGRFITTTTFYHNQREEVVATHLHVLFRYTSAEVQPPGHAGEQTQEVLATPSGGVEGNAGEASPGTGSRHLFWKEVEPSMEIPAISLELTTTRMIMAAAGTRDLYPIHHDPEFARAAGHKDMLVNVIFQGGLLGRCITDWTGPSGILRRLRVAGGVPCYRGDTIWASGRVIRKYLVEGEGRIDCQLHITKQDGMVAVNAEASVDLPRHSV